MVLGLLAATAGRWPEVERQFQSALATHERANARPLVARTRSEFAQALARKRAGKLHVGRVRTTLEQALEEAHALDMVSLAAEIEAAIKRMGPSR